MFCGIADAKLLDRWMAEPYDVGELGSLRLWILLVVESTECDPDLCKRQWRSLDGDWRLLVMEELEPRGRRGGRTGYSGSDSVGERREWPKLLPEYVEVGLRLFVLVECEKLKHCEEILLFDPTLLQPVLHAVVGGLEESSTECVSSGLGKPPIMPAW